MVGLVGPFLYLAVTLNTLVNTHPDKGDHEYPQYKDLWIVAVSAVVCFFWEKSSSSLSHDFFTYLTKASDDKDQKKYYVDKAKKSFYYMQYFVGVAVWGYVVLKPTGWIPWHLGGNKSIEEAYHDQMHLQGTFPFTKAPRPVLVFMLSTMGFHVSNIIQACLKKEKSSDFNEMLLHHIATCSLYFCSIYGNAMSIGCTIAYLHDIADAFVHIGKLLSTTEYEGLTTSVGLFLFFLWFWTRLFVLPNFIYLIYITPQMNLPGVRSYCVANAFFLGVL